MQHSRHRSEHCMPGRVFFSVCCCWCCRCHELFHRLAFLDIFRNCWTTAARDFTSFCRPHTCSLVHRHHLQELFTFVVGRPAVKLELDSQVPSTTASVMRVFEAFLTRYTFHQSGGKTVSQPQRLRSCVDRSALPMFMTLKSYQQVHDIASHVLQPPNPTSWRRARAVCRHQPRGEIHTR